MTEQQAQILVGRWHLGAIKQADLHEIFGRDRQSYKITNRFMEAIIGTVEIQKWFLVIRALIEIMAEFVMDRHEIARIDLSTHFDSQIIDIIDIPSARMADNFAVGWLGDLRALIKTRRECGETKRGIKALARLDHFERIIALGGQQRASIITNIASDRRTLAAKDLIAPRYADLVYEGRWWTTEREGYDAFVNVTQERVTGSVTLKLFKGSASVVGRESQYALYDERFVTFGEDDVYQQSDAAGFIRLYGLSARVRAIRDQEMAAAAQRDSQTKAEAKKPATLAIA